VFPKEDGSPTPKWRTADLSPRRLRTAPGPLTVEPRTGLINQILSAPTWTVLGLVALIVFVEDALFVGFVIPGETAAILGGVAASLGHAPLAAVVAVVIVAAIVGDSVGYEVGR
jgi:membrane protease YdiL (CAAX protease family)